MKIDRSLMLIAGVVVVLLLLAGLGYENGAFSGTPATPAPPVAATATPTAQPAKVLPTVIPTATPTAAPTVPWNNGVGFETINSNPAAINNGAPTAIDNGSPATTVTPTPTLIGDIVPSSTLDGTTTSDATYTVVDSQGITVGMTGLPYDDYLVTAYLIGYEPQTQTVTVNDASVPVTFEFITTTAT